MTEPLECESEKRSVFRNACVLSLCTERWKASALLTPCEFGHSHSLSAREFHEIDQNGRNCSNNWKMSDFATQTHETQPCPWSLLKNSGHSYPRLHGFTAVSSMCIGTRVGHCARSDDLPFDMTQIIVQIKMSDGRSRSDRANAKQQEEMRPSGWSAIGRCNWRFCGTIYLTNGINNDKWHCDRYLMIILDESSHELFRRNVREQEHFVS
jgi:hypothetical protein